VGQVVEVARPVADVRGVDVDVAVEVEVALQRH